MSQQPRNPGLGVIFSFFLGLMVTAFFGVGVFTFYPYPEVYQTEIDESFRLEREIRDNKAWDELTPDEREQLNQLADERREYYHAQATARGTWSRNTSIILIALATLTMAAALTLSQALLVVSNGLLLGGLFTMLYGVGWILFTDTSFARFGVITVALISTLILGYVRFVGQRRVPATGGAAVGRSVSTEAGLADIERRVAELERRLDGAANALGDKRT